MTQTSAPVADDTPTHTAKPPGPGSLLWDIYSDVTLGPFSAAILVLQAAHPDIGAAVARYSVYKDEPWGRLFRTLFSMVRFLHGGKNGDLARREAKALRQLHAHIKGTRPDGAPYHALRPESFRIVPDTFLAGAVHFRHEMGQPLSAAERQQIFNEYINLCLLFKIPREALEDNLDQFESYFEALLLNTMTYNDTVAFLLGDMMAYGPRMKYLPLPERWWQWFYHRTSYPIIRLFTLGFLDPRFRDKHPIPWSEKDERRYRRWLKVLRGIRRVVPRWLRYNPFALYIMIGGRGPGIISVDKLNDARYK